MNEMMMMEDAAYKKMGGYSTLGFKGAVKSFFGSEASRSSFRMAADWHGFGPGKLLSFGRGLGLGFTIFEGIEGYKEDGMWGAIKGAGGGFARDWATIRAFKVLSGGMGLTGALASTGIAVGAAATGIGLLGGLAATSQGMSLQRFGTQAFVGRYMQKRSKLEIASPVDDQYGTMATMRQRSINAMRQSRITARNALGMEANRRYTPYFR